MFLEPVPTSGEKMHTEESIPVELLIVLSRSLLLRPIVSMHVSKCGAIFGTDH